MTPQERAEKIWNETQLANLADADCVRFIAAELEAYAEEKVKEDQKAHNARVESVINEIRGDEREACAKIADDMAIKLFKKEPMEAELTALRIRDAIRSRGDAR